jgi:drug/metabolite transporter (DMT)-like permease
MSNVKTYLAGAGWASIFGLSFLMTKGALEAFSPFELLFLRFALATAALGALAIARLIRLDFKGKPMLQLALLCFFQPVLYFALETYGLKETASSTAGLILGALPAAVAALSVPMLKERLSPRQAIGLCVSVAGVALIVLDGRMRSGSGGATDSLRGVLLVIGALASAALYNVYSRRASAHFSPAETTFAMMASGAASFGLFALVENLLPGATRQGPGILARATPAAWGAVAYLGLLSSVLAFFLVNLSLSRLKASQASIFGTLTTLVALIAGVCFRGESLSLVELAGAAAVIGGVWATNARTDPAILRK